MEPDWLPRAAYLTGTCPDVAGGGGWEPRTLRLTRARNTKSPTKLTGSDTVKKDLTTSLKGRSRPPHKLGASQKLEKVTNKAMFQACCHTGVLRSLS